MTSLSNLKQLFVVQNCKGHTIAPWVDVVTNVLVNGHCGFRVFSVYAGTDSEVGNHCAPEVLQNDESGMIGFLRKWSTQTFMLSGVLLTSMIHDVAENLSRPHISVSSLQKDYCLYWTSIATAFNDVG